MKRAVGIILIVLFASMASGVDEWLHVRLEHSDHAAIASQGSGPQWRAAAQDHDGCLTCMTLHAQFDAPAAPRFDPQVGLVARRVLTLQAQRLDASVPARRGCRGPPV